MDTETEWAPAPDRPGYMVKELKHGNCTIFLYRPELDAAERKKRENYLKSVAESVLASYYKRKDQTS